MIHLFLFRTFKLHTSAYSSNYCEYFIEWDFIKIHFLLVLKWHQILFKGEVAPQWHEIVTLDRIFLWWPNAWYQIWFLSRQLISFEISRYFMPSNWSNFSEKNGFQSQAVFPNPTISTIDLDHLARIRNRLTVFESGIQFDRIMTRSAQKDFF